MISQIEDNEMPIPSYIYMHSEAKLSEHEKTSLIDYLSNIKDSLDIK